jgi:cytochrome c-type biogenesis protein
MIAELLNGLSGYLHGSSCLAFAAAYLGGVLVGFTPCVYPVAPITVAFIGSRCGGSRGSSFVLSVVYVLGMSLVYAGLGAAAALSGSLFGQIQTNPWTYFVMANICIAMGLSMLGVFSVSVPVPRFAVRADTGGRAKGMAGSFLLGVASGFVMGPCVTPVLGVLLAFVAAGQHVLFGMSLLFFFSFGMGSLMIILGTFAGLLACLPRSGAWMARVSQLFGVVFLATGEYFLIKTGAFWG